MQHAAALQIASAGQDIHLRAMTALFAWTAPSSVMVSGNASAMTMMRSMAFASQVKVQMCVKD
jgi:hypothetical protein